MFDRADALDRQIVFGSEVSMMFADGHLQFLAGSLTFAPSITEGFERLLCTNRFHFSGEV